MINKQRLRISGAAVCLSKNDRLFFDDGKILCRFEAFPRGEGVAAPKHVLILLLLMRCRDGRGQANLSCRRLSDIKGACSVSSCQAAHSLWYASSYRGKARLPSSVTMPLTFAVCRRSSVSNRLFSGKTIIGIVPPSPRGKAFSLSNVVLNKSHLDFFYSLRADSTSALFILDFSVKK